MPKQYEYVPSSALEVLAPVEQASLQSLVARQMQQAPLSAWEQFKIARAVKRYQAGVIVS
jgi:hypothetical protein